jgi:hypothetical protein
MAAVYVLVIEPIRITSSAVAATPGAASPIVATCTWPSGVPTTATTPPMSVDPYQSAAIRRIRASTSDPMVDVAMVAVARCVVVVSTIAVAG